MEVIWHSGTSVFLINSGLVESLWHPPQADAAEVKHRISILAARTSS